jgi:hypothetical protein
MPKFWLLSYRANVIYYGSIRNNWDYKSCSEVISSSSAGINEGWTSRKMPSLADGHFPASDHSA